jgi:hypothetical protein
MHNRVCRFILNLCVELRVYSIYLQLRKVDIFSLPALKVPKREIFDRSDFPDFYRIKSSWVGDLVVKILTYYFNF